MIFPKISPLIISTLSFTLFVHGIGIFLLLHVAHREFQRASHAFKQNSPDLIATFTGAQGRISHTLGISKQYPSSHIFITGVSMKGETHNLVKAFDSTLLDIDFFAENTIENVLSLKKYLDKKEPLQKTLIISHDYHIKRIKLTMNKMMPEHNKDRFFYMGISPDYRSLRNLKILFKQLYKTILMWFYFLTEEMNLVTSL